MIVSVTTRVSGAASRSTTASGFLLRDERLADHAELALAVLDRAALDQRVAPAGDAQGVGDGARAPGDAADLPVAAGVGRVHGLVRAMERAEARGGRSGSTRGNSDLIGRL